MDLFQFYNCAPPGKHIGGPRALTKELHALLAESPIVLGLAETIGYRLPEVKNFHLLRDTSTPGRANVAAYVSTTVALTNVHWHDLHKGWPATEHPGIHAPRAFLSFDAPNFKGVVHHEPPDAPGAGPAREESKAAVVGSFAPWTRSDWDRRDEAAQKRAKARARVLLMDANGNQREIADRTGGSLVVPGIDTGVLLNATCVSAEYVKHVGGVPLGSDHGHALVFKAKVAR